MKKHSDPIFYSISYAILSCLFLCLSCSEDNSEVEYEATLVVESFLENEFSLGENVFYLECGGSMNWSSFKFCDNWNIDSARVSSVQTFSSEEIPRVEVFTTFMCDDTTLFLTIPTGPNIEVHGEYIDIYGPRSVTKVKSTGRPAIKATWTNCLD